MSRAVQLQTSVARGRSRSRACGVARVVELVDAGKFTVNVEQVFPMSEAALAWQKSREGHTTGKLIVRISEGPTMKHQ